MSVKDSVAGTAKRLVAEIVGDGRLAEEGTRQAGELTSSPEPRLAQPQPASKESTTSGAARADEAKFAALLGRAALGSWADLPRDAQERLFAAAVDDGVIANDLAEFLHDHHPRTAHPPKPTRLA